MSEMNANTEATRRIEEIRKRDRVSEIQQILEAKQAGYLPAIQAGRFEEADRIEQEHAKLIEELRLIDPSADLSDQEKFYKSEAVDLTRKHHKRLNQKIE